MDSRSRHGATIGLIRTPFNRRVRTESRILIDGKWCRPDPEAANTLKWLRAKRDDDLAFRRANRADMSNALEGARTLLAA